MISWPKLDKSLSKEDIVQFEKKIGVKLPQDFIEWYSQYDLSDKHELVIDVQGETCGLDGIYPIEMVIREVDDFFEEDKTYKDKGTAIPFAFDSILSQYFFFYPTGNKKPSGIFFRHHDYEVTDLFHGNNVKESFYISSTFQEFLNKIYIREEDI